ncbi:MAG TPA: hypothetical protein VIA18_05415 [Polyangia bacterium]|jgi:hypothetical protein|nr:hypothetical protein [Polyangia bacterium]
MLTKMALAALVATVGVGAMATPASAQERGGFGGRGGFSRGHERGGEYGRRGGGFERGGERGGWGHASYGYAHGGRGYCR